MTHFTEEQIIYLLRVRSQNPSLKFYHVFLLTFDRFISWSSSEAVILFYYWVFTFSFHVIASINWDRMSKTTSINQNDASVSVEKQDTGYCNMKRKIKWIARYNLVQIFTLRNPLQIRLNFLNTYFGSFAEFWHWPVQWKLIWWIQKPLDTL